MYLTNIYRYGLRHGPIYLMRIAAKKEPIFASNIILISL
ncbi:hypothetical protein SPHINGO8BC_90349 [Sphingobacterium multivorum]|uniref:Uncharacterized protein n=1 Tax=Sphingobacterium multivorum TaxID=28454 RepID=A0A654E022_SPHMU|nr:hypothetical protein SPHINGO8BC_90349 [Sphingobacterium multivorum]